MTQPPHAAPLTQWLIWFAGTLIIVPISCLIGGILAFLVIGESDSDSVLLSFSLLVAFLAGCLSGAGQYVLVRRITLDSAAFWMILTVGATVLGGMIGFASMYLIRNWCMVGISIGALVGGSQWLILQERLRSAHWWVAMMVGVWGAYLWLFNWHQCNRYAHICWP